MSRILWFHPRPWGPPRGGGDLRTRGLVQCALASGHTVGLVVPAGAPPGDLPDRQVLLEYAPRTGWPLRLAKVASRHPLRSPRASAGAITEVRRAIEDFCPDVAVVSEVMSWSVARRLVPSGLPVVYDAANVESALFRDLAARGRGGDRVTFGIDARRVTRDERELLVRSRAVLAVSDEERDVLRGMATGQRVEVVPSSVDHPAASWTLEAGQDSVLFVGTLDYPPNVDAVVELAERVLPRVRRELPARLVVVGRRPVPVLRDLAAAHPWIELHEDVPDLAPYYLAARCAVLPIRSGGGTKLKVYEALAYGVPLVGTPEAIAGVPVQVDREVLVSADPMGLARHATRLLADDGLAARLGAEGRRAFEERLSWERAAREPLHRLVEDVSSSRTG